MERLLEADGDVNRALQTWEATQLEQGYALLAKVRHMGRVLQSGGSFVPGDAAFRWGLPAVAEPGASQICANRVAGIGAGLAGALSS